ncbi:MAG: STAS domain-containing protein [Kangiellaceae bacterium]|nr:STAS domain-containing protein [Kangiellaceae bacterium]
MKLPENCTVESIESIHQSIVKLMDKPSITLDAKQVERVDISFIQLLIALQKEQKSVIFETPSAKLSEFLSLYQLDDMLASE